MERNGSGGLGDGVEGLVAVGCLLPWGEEDWARREERQRAWVVSEQRKGDHDGEGSRLAMSGGGVHGVGSSEEEGDGLQRAWAMVACGGRGGGGDVQAARFGGGSHGEDGEREASGDEGGRRLLGEEEDGRACGNGVGQLAAAATGRQHRATTGFEQAADLGGRPWRTEEEQPAMASPAVGGEEMQAVGGFGRCFGRRPAMGETAGGSGTGPWRSRHLGGRRGCGWPAVAGGRRRRAVRRTVARAAAQAAAQAVARQRHGESGTGPGKKRVGPQHRGCGPICWSMVDQSPKSVRSKNRAAPEIVWLQKLCCSKKRAASKSVLNLDFL